MAWAPAATATSREEEGNYEHGFLQTLSMLTSIAQCGGGSVALGVCTDTCVLWKW